MVDEIIKRRAMVDATRKMANSQVSCLACWQFSLRQKKIVNYEGKTVFVMRGCRNYRDCHNGGPKSLWAAR